MKAIPLLPISAAAALFLAACNQPATDSGGSDVREIALTGGTPEPAAVNENAAAELAKQAIGKKLLGNTVKVAGGAFVAADLAKAPEYYLAYYSASW